MSVEGRIAPKRIGRLSALAFCLLLTAPLAVSQQPQLSNIGAAPLRERAPLDEASRLIAKSQFKEAELRLRAYLDTDGRSGQARYMLAYALLRQNKPKDSLAEYTRAAALQKPTAEELRRVAQDYVLLEDYADANKWLLRSIQMAPADPDGWYNLGRLRYTEQRYPNAAECFERALKLAPHNVKIENNLGLAYEGLNRPEDALKAYRQAIAWQDAGPPGEASEQPLLNLAIMLMHQAQLDEAQALLLRAVALAPQDPRVREQLGQSYLQQRNFTEAQKQLEVATRLDPEKSNLHFLLGQAYRRLGRQPEAKAQFDLAARLANPAPTQ